jgi:hypothetical protein
MNAFQMLTLLASGKATEQEECDRKNLNKLIVVGVIVVGALLGGLIVVFVR